MKLTRCNPALSATAVPAAFQGFLRPSFAGLTAFDQLFDLAGFPAFKTSAVAPATLAVDVYEDEGHYYARFEVPGVKKEDAKVELEDRRLAVTVSRKTQTAEGESSFELSRSLTVPEGIEVEKIAAKIEDGLLTVTLPKAEVRKPRIIELN
jgi:HSP20 family protein